MNSHDNPMGERHAVPFNSGLPVDHSGPELGAGPTPPATADRKSEARPSGPISQHKSGQGFRGQSPLVVREAGHELRSEAKQLSSLVYYQTNRNKPENRHRQCGAFTAIGTDRRAPSPIDIPLKRFISLKCKRWNCQYCGPKRAKRTKAAIRAMAEAHGLSRFLTLTLDPKKLEAVGDPVAYIRSTFNKFRVYLQRRYGKGVKYICVLEFHKSGLPHLHILLGRFIPQKWISKTWDRIGGGNRAFIKQVNIGNIAHYLSKYLTKEMLLSAPPRARRITSSRNITLFPKIQTAKHISWELRRRWIGSLFADFVDTYAVVVRELFCVVDVRGDEEGLLESFAVPV
jgi:hypothetical protein